MPKKEPKKESSGPNKKTVDKITEMPKILGELFNNDFCSMIGNSSEVFSISWEGNNNFDVRTHPLLPFFALQNPIAAQGAAYTDKMFLEEVCSIPLIPAPYFFSGFLAYLLSKAKDTQMVNGQVKPVVVPGQVFPVYQSSWSIWKDMRSALFILKHTYSESNSELWQTRMDDLFHQAATMSKSFSTDFISKAKELLFGMNISPLLSSTNGIEKDDEEEPKDFTVDSRLTPEILSQLSSELLMHMDLLKLFYILLHMHGRSMLGVCESHLMDIFGVRREVGIQLQMHKKHPILIENNLCKAIRDGCIKQQRKMLEYMARSDTLVISDRVHYFISSHLSHLLEIISDPELSVSIPDTGYSVSLLFLWILAQNYVIVWQENSVVTPPTPHITANSKINKPNILTPGSGDNNNNNNNNNNK